mgnify:CR=1 FL=1
MSKIYIQEIYQLLEELLESIEGIIYELDTIKFLNDHPNFLNNHSEHQLNNIFPNDKNIKYFMTIDVRNITFSQKYYFTPKTLPKMFNKKVYYVLSKKFGIKSLSGVLGSVPYFINSFDYILMYTKKSLPNSLKYHVESVDLNKFYEKEFPKKEYYKD